MRVRTAETASPINRSGSESSQTKGHATRTITAIGQLSRNRMHQPINNNSAIAVSTTGMPLAPASNVMGWIYNTVTGQIVMNSNSTDSKGAAYSTH